MQLPLQNDSSAFGKFNNLTLASVRLHVSSGRLLWKSQFRKQPAWATHIAIMLPKVPVSRYYTVLVSFSESAVVAILKLSYCQMPYHCGLIFNI
jgi:hypothetical protein